MPKETVDRKTETKTITKTKAPQLRVKKFYPYLIIMVLLLIIGAYYFLSDRAQRNQSLQSLRQQNTAAQTEITQLQTQIEAIGQRQAQLMEQIQTHGFSNTKWVLSSVVYLLQQAQLKLTIEHDVATAIVLLNTAQQRVAALHNKKLQSLSIAIKNDLHTLNAINKVDLYNLSKQFTVLNNRINNLSLKLMIEKQQPSTTVVDKKGWRKALTNSLQALRGIVVVQRTDRKFTPLLQQQQLVSFKQYLQALAQQAFWSALNDNAALYYQRLAAISSALQHYILSSNVTAELIQQQIKNLEKIKIVAKFPSKLLALETAKKMQTEKVVMLQGNHK